MTPVIVRDKSVLGGKPRIAGTRISVGTVVSYLISGHSYQEIQRDYPRLTREQIDKAREYVLRHPKDFNLVSETV